MKNVILIILFIGLVITCLSYSSPRVREKTRLWTGDEIREVIYQLKMVNHNLEKLQK